MRFALLKARVEHAEQSLQAQQRSAASSWRQFGASWKQSWTPGRIVIAGLISGFLSGKAQPIASTAARSALRVPTLLNAIGAVAALFRIDNTVQTNFDHMTESLTDRLEKTSRRTAAQIRRAARRSAAAAAANTPRA